MFTGGYRSHPIVGGSRVLASRAVRLAVVALALSSACTGGTGGCSALRPLADRFPSADKQDNGANVRVSPAGITFLNTNWGALVEMFAPGKHIDIPFGCMSTNLPGAGTVIVSDQGTA